jgi:hypothetical protein
MEVPEEKLATSGLMEIFVIGAGLFHDAARIYIKDSVALFSITVSTLTDFAAADL